MPINPASRKHFWNLLRLFTVAAVFISATGTPPAQALPFDQNCASMQKYFNALLPDSQVSDFEGRTFEVIMNYSVICRDGIVKDRTSAGTEICRASLEYVISSKNMYYHPSSCYLR